MRCMKAATEVVTEVWKPATGIAGRDTFVWIWNVPTTYACRRSRRHRIALPILSRLISKRIFHQLLLVENEKEVAGRLSAHSE